MKKLIVIIFILLIGLFVVNGCASPSEPETSEQDTRSQVPETQQQAESGQLPRPPALPKE